MTQSHLKFSLLYHDVLYKSLDAVSTLPFIYTTGGAFHRLEMREPHTNSRWVELELTRIDANKEMNVKRLRIDDSRIPVDEKPSIMH